MTLTKEDFLEIENRRGEEGGQKVSLTTGTFYLKYRKCFDFKALNEIIISRLSSILGIVCPKYYLVIPNFEYNRENECFILSEDLNNKGYFSLASSLGIGANANASLISSWLYLSQKYGDDEAMHRSLMATYLFSLFFGFNDFHNKNWGVISNGKENKIAILDNEYSFYKGIKPKMSFYPSKVDYDLDIALNKDIEPLELNIKYFLKTAQEEDISLFISLYYLFTPSYVKSILDSLKEEMIITRDGLKPLVIDQDEVLNKYEAIYNSIKAIWNDLIENEGTKKR